MEEVFNSAKEKVKEDQIRQEMEIVNKSLRKDTKDESDRLQDKTSASDLLALVQASMQPQNSTTVTPASSFPTSDVVASNSHPRSFGDLTEKNDFESVNPVQKMPLLQDLPLSKANNQGNNDSINQQNQGQWERGVEGKRLDNRNPFVQDSIPNSRTQGGQFQGNNLIGQGQSNFGGQGGQFNSAGQLGQFQGGGQGGKFPMSGQGGQFQGGVQGGQTQGDGQGHFLDSRQGQTQGGQIQGVGQGRHFKDSMQEDMFRNSPPAGQFRAADQGGQFPGDGRGRKFPDGGQGGQFQDGNQGGQCQDNGQGGQFRGGAGGLAGRFVAGGGPFNSNGTGGPFIQGGSSGPLISNNRVDQSGQYRPTGVFNPRGNFRPAFNQFSQGSRPNFNNYENSLQNNIGNFRGRGGPRGNPLFRGRGRGFY